MAFAVDLTGSILDRRYRITGLLGKGGMGHVYEAVHVALDQRVAVKVLHPRYAHEERFRERFLQEARAASKIRHPNVVEIKDFGETPDGSVYFAMEYLHGHDVGVELEQHGRLPWSRTRKILLQAVGALQAAHINRIVHRDIKPANCFLIEDQASGVLDMVKLLDFGIAKVGTDSHADAQGKGLTGTGEVFGTASYMAPEQARGETLDARSDMYSLGIMAYEMLTGQVPFTGVNAIHVITRHLNDKPESLRARASELPSMVDALVLKMIAKSPGDRYGSMDALEHALREIPEDAGIRRTRLWSSPGDLRALVEEKKAASAKVLPPGSVETDAEQTAVVVPAGGGGRRLGGPGVGVAKVVSAAAAEAGPTPGAPLMIPAAPAQAPVGPRSYDVVVPVALAAAAALPQQAPIPASPPFQTGPQPHVFGPFVMEERSKTLAYAWADGTNPPPGRSDLPMPSGTWASSTGPHGMLGDTGSEMGPVSPETMRAPPISWRLVAVVGLLVVLVGGASAAGTMVFLAGRDTQEERTETEGRSPVTDIEKSSPATSEAPM